MNSNEPPESSIPPPDAPATPPGGAGADGEGGFCTWYINRWGRLMVASDYGYKAWRFRDKANRKTSS